MAGKDQLRAFSVNRYVIVATVGIIVAVGGALALLWQPSRGGTLSVNETRIPAEYSVDVLIRNLDKLPKEVARRLVFEAELYPDVRATWSGKMETPIRYQDWLLFRREEGCETAILHCNNLPRGEVHGETWLVALSFPRRHDDNRW